MALFVWYIWEVFYWGPSRQGTWASPINPESVQITPTFVFNSGLRRMLTIALHFIAIVCLVHLGCLLSWGPSSRRFATPNVRQKTTLHAFTTSSFWTMWNQVIHSCRLFWYSYCHRTLYMPYAMPIVNIQVLHHHTLIMSYVMPTLVIQVFAIIP